MYGEHNDSLSEFYLACRSGEQNKVENFLSRLSLYELNQLESNGSTALHAAAFFGHVEVVRLLMKHGGILTTLPNLYHLTPAEESNDTIRRLLLLPDVVQVRFQCTNDMNATLFTPLTGISSIEGQPLILTTNEPIDQRPDWIDAYDNAHRIALENHEYMRKWITKIPLTQIINTILNDYVNQMNETLTEDNLSVIREYIKLANDDDDVRYLLYAYTTPTSFFKQVNIDLAQRGSDFRFENNISKKYQDNEPPLGFGQYLFAAVIINHPSIDQWRFTGVSYRGMNITNNELNQYTSDARILTRSFLSTSKRIDTAFLYLQYNNPVLRPVLCVYRVTQYYTSLAISDFSAVQAEDEVLIIPFVAFRVVKVDIDGFYVSDGCRVSVIFLDEVTTNEQRQSWPLAAVIEDEHLVSEKSEKINEQFPNEAYSVSSMNILERQNLTSSFFTVLYEKHRTTIDQYVEYCLTNYSHWITNELWNIRYSIIMPLLDSSFFFTAHEKQWIHENPDCFRLYYDQALLPPLVSCNKKTVDIVDLLIEQRAIIILGDPGSGKTTWTRWLMWKCIQMFRESLENSDHRVVMPLPILIPIDNFIKYMSEKPSVSFFDCICRIAINDPNEQILTCIAEYLSYGHLLIILDGLDTLDDPQKQDHLVNLLIQFQKSTIFWNESDRKIRTENRLIVIINHIQSLPEEYFSFYRLTSLSLDVIDDFIDNWWNNHCSYLRNGTVNNFDNQWNERVDQLKSLFERYPTFKELLSNILILSTICQWMTLQILVGAPPKKRIHYYGISVFVLFARFQKWPILKQIEREIFLDILADIADYLQEYSSSGLIEKFDLNYKYRASIRTHSARLSIDDQSMINTCLISIIDKNSLFFLRNTNSYGFLSIPIQHLFACLFLIRTTNTKQSKVELIVERFLCYMTKSNFREPLLLGLEWISSQWNSEDLNTFCRLLFTNNNDQFHHILPLGAMLLMTTLPDLVQNPYEKTLQDAFDRFLIVSKNREWLVRFPIFIDYLIDGLNYLPLSIARTWIYDYFKQCSTIEHNRSVLNVLMNLICFSRKIPIWMRNDDHQTYSLNVLQCQARIDYTRNKEGNGLFVGDRFLTTISIIDSSLFTSGFVRQSLLRFNVDSERLSPIYLTVLIALYGGLNRFTQLHLDNRDTVVFSTFHMHRDSLQNSWLIHYLNTNCWTHLPSTDEIEQQVRKLLPNDDSPETVDLFIAWLCLKGVKQPWVFRKYMSWSAFQSAINRFHRLVLYLSEFYYVKYDVEVELEAPSTFRDDALLIINQYSEKGTGCSTLLHCVAVALARLMIVGGQRSLFYPDGSFCPRMLDLNLTDSKSIADLWQCSDSHIASFLPLLWKPFLPREVKFLCEKFDSDSILTIANETHPIFTFGQQTSFLLTLIPRHFHSIFDRFLNSSNSFPFVCLLGEIVRVLSTQKKGSIRFALLLAVLRIHFENNQWAHIFRGLLGLANRTRDVNPYFYKFDHFLSKKYGQLSFDEKTLEEEHLEIELIRARQRAEELRKTSANSVQLYEVSIAIAVLSCALHQRDEQPGEIADEIQFTIANIREPILRLHALSITWTLTQNYTTTSTHRMNSISQKALAAVDTQNSIEDHTLLFLMWWTTFAPIVDTRTIACQVHCLLDHLLVNIDTDSIEIQQVVCQSLLFALHHDIYPYVRSRICHFIQNSRWSNLTNICQFQSGALSALINENNYNPIFVNPSISTLLASMYLMQLSIDIFYLPTWFEMESTNNRQTTLDRIDLEQAAIEQWRISSEHGVVSKEAARIMSNLLRTYQDKSSDYHSLERLLAKCNFVEKSAQSDVIQWLQYKDHSHLSIFAFHAALLITKYSIDAIQLCCQLLDYPSDEFRQRAKKCLSSVCLCASSFTRDRFIQLFTQLLRAYRTQSILAREILINIDIRIDSIEFLDLLFIWERERIHLLVESSQAPHYLTHDLELHHQNMRTSLFDYVHLQSGSLDLLEYLFEYVSNRCSQLQSDSERKTIEEQSYLTELVQFIGRVWDSSVMSEMSICEQNFASHIIVLLTDVTLSPMLSKAIVNVLLINRSTAPYVPIFTRIEARQCMKSILIEIFQNPSKQYRDDEILANIIKNYFHVTNDADEYILVRLQECSNRNIIVAAADIARIHCRSLRRPKPNLNEFLQLVNGEYIRLYHALLSIVVDPRTIFIIHSITLDLISKHEDELLSLFVEEFSRGQHSNHIRLACTLVDRILPRMQNAIEHKEKLAQSLLQRSQDNKDDRDCCIRFLTSYCRELTIDIKQMFLSAMWDRHPIQLVAYECVANIQRVNSRAIVEDLYHELLLSKSFQRRYISAMLLVQLAKFDQVSIYEVQQTLTEAINQPTTMSGTITHEGKQKLDQALFNLLTQLSFILDRKHEDLNDYHKPNYTNFYWELEYIIDADEYASLTFPSML
ncbi:unnamed protein product [Rotaria socialis]